MTRISKVRWAYELAEATAKRSTCLRRQVGCVLLDEQWRVLSTGYNGVARGMPHCNEPMSGGSLLNQFNATLEKGMIYPHSCPGAGSSSGTDLDRCLAIHAEQNALLQCRDVDRIHYCFATTSPCVTCTKLLLNTNCQVIYALTPYPHDEASKKLWASGNRVGYWNHGKDV